MSRALVLAAPAKVNLTLEVLARRPDGYHELASVFATVDVRDRVRVAPSRALDVRVSPDVGAAAEDELATRAVRALAHALGRPPAAHVRVAKRIPVAAGLGGGSSDAGAVLRGLARIWRLDGVDLCAVGAGIGSDVPFFASGAAFALVTGRGERVEPLPSPQASLWVALVRIRARVATAAVFARHRGSRAAAHDSAALSEAFRNGGATPAVVRAHLMNDLLATAEDIAPAIRDARAVAERAGVPLALSGSGPSLFAVADDRADAIRIARRLRRAGLDARPRRLGFTP